MKRSHLSNFGLPLSPLAAIHSRYRSVSVTVLLYMNVIGIADAAFRIVRCLAEITPNCSRESTPPSSHNCSGILKMFRAIPFND